MAALLLAPGGVLAYVRAEIVSSRAFSGRLVSSLDDASVRSATSEQIVNGLVGGGRSADLLAIRPILSSAIGSLVASPLFRRTALVAAEGAHGALVRGDGSVALRVASRGETILDAVRSVSPAVGERISPTAAPILAELSRGDRQLSVARSVVDVSALWWLFVAGGISAAAGAALLAGGRRGVAYVGVALAVAGAAVAGLVTAAGAIASSRVAGDRERSAVRGVWASLFGDLRVAGLVVAASGLVVCALASGWLRRRRGRAPSDIAAESPAAPRSVPARGAATAAVVTVLAAASAAVAVSLAAPSPPSPEAPPPGGCNGSPQLCERRLNDVVFPATHNSYAAADEPGWLFANQRFSISRQLDDGIRGLLLDIHYGVLDRSTGHVRTDLRAEGMDRNKVARALSPEALRTADRLAGRVGVGELAGKPELYLCHTLCELGAEPLGQELRVIHRFLESHHNEVLLVIVEDYVPPGAIEASFSEAGLLPYVAQLDRSAPLPTLSDLIHTGKRLVVFAEAQGGTPPWYLPAFAFIQDTAYDASTPAALDCSRNRGQPDSPLLLLNHWIARFPPRVSDQVGVGGAFLRDRVRRCTKERGVPGAMVAVDFYERTGVVEVAKQLNAGAG